MYDQNYPSNFGGASPLILSAMTLHSATFEDRTHAAAVTGFQGIGWQFDDLLNEDATIKQSRLQLLASSGIRPLEIEFFRDWIDRSEDPSYRAQEEALFKLANLVKARHINVAVFKPTPQAQIVASLRALCRRAAAYRLIVQLEPMVYTPPIDSVSSAWEIIADVNEPNLGLLIDAWQWVRMDETPASLLAIPATKISSIQLSDTLQTPIADTVTESRHQRKIPGMGTTDVAHLLQAISKHGVHAPLSVEIMSDDLETMPVIDAAQAVAYGTREVLWNLQSL